MTNFKEGDILVCIDNNGQYRWLTKNKFYIIQYVCPNPRIIGLLDDENKKIHSVSDRFKKLEVGDVLKRTPDFTRWEVRTITNWKDTNDYIQVRKVGTNHEVCYNPKQLLALFTYCGAVTTPVKENKFKVGDKVKCIEDDELGVYGTYYGNIYEVVYHKYCKAGMIDKTRRFIDIEHLTEYQDSFELIKEEPKFKVGDVLRCIRDEECTVYGGIHIGNSYKVVKPNPPFGMKIDELPIQLVLDHTDSFELVSRVIGGVTYTKEEIELEQVDLGIICGRFHAIMQEEILNDKNMKKEKEMNKIIAEMYPKTKDALLVDKWFGSITTEFSHWAFNTRNSTFVKVLLKGKEEDLLKAAQELEAESKKRE